MFDNPRATAEMAELVQFINKQGHAYEEVRLYDDALIGVASFRPSTTLQQQAVQVSDDLLMCASQQHQMVYGALPFARIARPIGPDGVDTYDLVFPTPWAARPLATIWSSGKKEVLLAIPVWSFEGIPTATVKLCIDFSVAWRTAIDKLNKRQLYNAFAGKVGSHFVSKHGWVE